ncbi:hypothetical protein KAFR_0I02230 [Kazachstania africana CBS 2517]|uniref:DH domain-containing protein n=1 Tax=Kazachstania africana (strain ATCC 22294 / BCRC 22015 / CBS 2517 / CECT 1963 / NBRC 1671 / NRRL Y-8276) TaxID=1071382 RepID=H2B052_KAZAF|nr:hypothetical protein KAFR_0I02230 [Kazachstania africana CBS 2517]CCF60002.1 hypothetical protein KAFR_0I02230 [Kazachstania africana CBS 2517]
MNDLSSIYSQELELTERSVVISLFNNLLASKNTHQQTLDWIHERSEKEWLDDIFINSVLYHNVDRVIWGPFFICIYKDPKTDKFGSLTLDRFGITHINSIDLSRKSAYYPAIENLHDNDKNSNVKKCIAVSLLQKFSNISMQHLKYLTEDKINYDPVHAGDLSSGCKLVTSISPELFGKRLISAGLLTGRLINSTLMDVIYENNESTIDSNNRLVFHLGEQLEQLFDPVTEYSPEQTEYGYKPPEDDKPTETDSELVQAICNELLQLQSNFTFTLVEFLQKVLIALRVKVLNGEIDALSTVKLNRMFPPTIDEVTRINCIFLDSLKSSMPYGSLEVLKACSITIPYFYKAYTRHEAATKLFSRDIKQFLKHFRNSIPECEEYSEMKLEAIIKGPQEKLLKLKLIIDRLYHSKEWANEENKIIGKKNYDNIIDVIDSFGRLNEPVSSYSTRVFTPSGKILTELAKGWPVELQYKWLKRRVVGVYDIIDQTFSNKRALLVIFSDYIVFLSITDYELYYTDDGSNKPLISDILMNSLINEVALPSKIPKLNVQNYCYIGDVLVSIFDNDTIRFDALRPDAFSISCKLATMKEPIDAKKVAALVTKAKILEKDTAFHLFKACRDDISLYSTAHELEAYNNEKLKSKFALFLNIKPASQFLSLYNLHFAVFASFVGTDDTNKVRLSVITRSNKDTVKTLEIFPDNIVDSIIGQLSTEYPLCYSSIQSSLIKELFAVTTYLANSIGKVGEKEHTLREAAAIVKDSNKSSKTNTLVNSDAEKKHSKAKDIDAKASKKIKKKTDNSTQKRISKIPESKNVMNLKPQEVKKKSLIEKLKSIFKSKRRSKKDISGPIVVNSKSYSSKSSLPHKKNNSPLPISPNKNILANTRSEKNLNAKNSSGKNPGVKSNDDAENLRISSVVRDTTYDASGARFQYTPRIGDLSKEKTEDIAEPHTPDEYTQLSQIPSPHIAEKLFLPKESKIHEPVDEVSEHEDIAGDISALTQSTSQENVEVLSAGQSGKEKDVSKRAHNQSQLYNSDLFEDFVPPGKECGHNIEIKQASEELSDDNLPTEKSSTQNQLHNVEKNNAVTLNSGEDNTKEKKNGTFHAGKQDPFVDIANPPIVQENIGVLPKKLNIFPTIPKLAPISRMEFTRSPSLIELFEGMRVVLDETDAHYNWKRLSSEVSLNQKYITNSGNTPENNNNFRNFAHAAAFNLAIPKNVETIVIPDEKAELESSHSTNGTLKTGDDHSKTTVPSVEEVSEEAVGKSPLKHEENPSLAANDTNRDRALDSERKFKVINTSPTRYSNIGSSEKQLASTTSETDFSKASFENPEDLQLSIARDISSQKLSVDTTTKMVPDFSFLTEMNREVTTRLFELNLASQEDVNDEEYYTPTTNAPKENMAASTSDQVETENETSIGLDVATGLENDLAKIRETSETHPEGDKSQNVATEESQNFLEDLEFSSFAMTFDNSLFNQYSSGLQEATLTHNSYETTKILDNIPELPAEKEGPVVYTLTNDLFSSNDIRIGINQKAGFMDNSNDAEDPIWVSPSKLDFDDITRTHVRTLGENIKDHAITRKNTKPDPPSNKLDDSELKHDLSYAFLANLVQTSEFDEIEEENYNDDKPTRLQFKS